jgi:predicted secreted protein
LWTKTYGRPGEDVGFYIEETSDNGYIVVGQFDDISNWDFWLLKLNSVGDSIWSKTYKGNYIDFGTAVKQLPDNGFIVSGATSSFGSGSFDFWLLRSDQNGDTLWTKTYGGTNYDDCWSLTVTQDNGFALFGRTESYGAGGTDMWLIKTNYNGDTLWTKTFGGANSEYGGKIDTILNNGYILTGYTSSHGMGGIDIWLLKTNHLGDTLWTKTFGGSYSDHGESLVSTSDSGYIICGGSRSYSQGDWDIYVIKTNPHGDSLWALTYGGSNTHFANSVIELKEGGYLLAGSTYSFGAGDKDIILMKLDSLGNMALLTDIPEPYSVKHDNFILSQNYPNPFNPETHIQFGLTQKMKVELMIYNVLGQQVKKLINQDMPPGEHEIIWDGKNDAGNKVNTGIYFYRLQAGYYVKSRKMVLMQ